MLSVEGQIVVRSSAWKHSSVLVVLRLLSATEPFLQIKSHVAPEPVKQIPGGLPGEAQSPVPALLSP